MKLTRKELYDLVWSEPMTTICKRFGLSDNGLRKHCKSMNIPTPSLGYWAKLQHGKVVEKIALPMEYEGKKQSVDLREVDPNEVVVELEPVVDEYKELEKELLACDASYFTVPEVLYAKDAIIIDTKEKHRQKYNSENTYLEKNPYRDKIGKTLNIYVSQKSLDRALCIFSTVIKALRFRGNDIKIDKETTYAVVEGEQIAIDMAERRRRVEKGSSATAFCGELSFNIHFGYRNKITIQDTAYTRLEDKIHSIIAHLEIKAQEIKQERIELEELRRKQAEEEKMRMEFEARQKAEVKEFKSLFKMAKRLYKANIIRDYIATYEEYLQEKGIDDKEVLDKLQWAKDKADWLDPFISKEDEYLDGYSKDKIIQSDCVKDEYLSGGSFCEYSESNFFARPWWKRKK